MKLISYLLITICVLGSTPDFGEWELKKTESNIKIYTRDVAGSDLKEFKATTVFKNVTMSDVLKQIYEAPAYHDNSNFSISYTIENLNSQAERYFYYSEELPWPLKNRDVVTKLALEEQDSNTVFLSIKVMPEGIPQKEKTIRIQDLKGSWLLEKHPDGIRATQQIYMDPGGIVPAFIVNSLIVKGPLKTFTTLKKSLKQ